MVALVAWLAPRLKISWLAVPTIVVDVMNEKKISGTATFTRVPEEPSVVDRAPSVTPHRVAWSKAEGSLALLGLKDSKTPTTTSASRLGSVWRNPEDSSAYFAPPVHSRTISVEAVNG